MTVNKRHKKPTASVTNIKSINKNKDTDNNVETNYNFSLWNIWVASTLLKILLYPSYHSTDFDVHRNWLAITNKLPLSKWYIENTSQWTLDYPPFFAYFEFVLSLFVPDIVKKDGCLDIVPKGEYGYLTVIFQRSTVIISELVLFFALQWFINSSKNIQERKQSFVIASSIVLSPGLFIVDHIHFQYNGMLFGILILSIVSAKLQRYCLCALFFAVLLCFKHIFLYLAPAYFVFLFSAYCIKYDNNEKLNFKDIILLKFINWWNLFKLGSIVIGVFTIAFGPFIYYGVISNLLARLFPFSRGLTHAYWAPNIWAVYSFADRVLIQLSIRVPGFNKLISLINPNFKVDDLIHNLYNNYSQASTKGLVGEVEFLILPNVKPSATFLLTLFYQIMSLIPLLIPIFQNRSQPPSFERFIGSLTLCGFASFLFGWHVHEKAIMLVIIPFTFIIPKNKKFLPLFQSLSSSGYVSLFPLLFGSQEWLFKALITFIWCIIYFTSFESVTPASKNNISNRKFMIDRLNLIYIVLFLPLTLIIQCLDIQSRNFMILQKLEFLRLLIYSIYCSIGVIGSWNGLCWLYFLDDEIWN